MSQVYITETILRDAHQCLIATRLRTNDILGICEHLDKVGYWSLEVWGGATFDACVRFLKEDPWERLKTIRKHIPNTRLQMLLRGQNLLGYRHYPDDVVRTFVQKSAENGIDVFRIFDALNDVRNLEVAIDAVKKAGKHAQGTICYTTSPVHTIEQFVAMGKHLAGMGCDSIAVKDMAGLLTPRIAANLMRELTANLSIPVHLHSHDTSGLSSLCHMKAVENGCRHIDTAISAFSGGASHACTESMVAAFNDTEFDTGLDLEALQYIGFYFLEVRKKYHQFESEGTGIDTRVQINQVPGGMISNLHNQLRQQNALNRLKEVQDEIPRVRKDLGFPPLVTPTSQIVGTQALLNVLTNERYKSITNEVKLYLQGRYGKSPAPVNEEVRQKAIGNEDVIECRPADLLKDEMEKLTEEIGSLARCPEDVLIFAMFPDIGREFLEQRENGTLEPEPLEPIEEKQSLVGRHGRPLTDFTVTLHGETYNINITGSGDAHKSVRPFYVTIDGVPEEILLESDDFDGQDESQESASGASGTKQSSGERPKASKPGHVTASMPGQVIEVLTEVGANVSAGDAVLVVEAMKMETEIQAPQGGEVKAIYVAKGDSVNPSEALIEIS